jgi:hypothetical protein
MRRRRFAYTNHPMIRTEVEKQYSGKMEEVAAMAQFGASGGDSGDDSSSSGHNYASYPHPMRRYPYQEDAFATIMQWLYDRIEKTR